MDAYNGLEGKPHGKYIRNEAIALGVKNYSTWAHELIHAADDRLGNLKETGQHWRSETVAELGGAILLEATGHECDSNLGGCFEYVRAYALDAGIEPVRCGKPVAFGSRQTDCTRYRCCLAEQEFNSKPRSLVGFLFVSSF